MEYYSDTVLIEIPCGTFQVRRSEGEVIRLCSTPPILVNIDYQKLTPQQEWEIDKFKEDWLIDSYWLIYQLSHEFSVNEQFDIINELPLKRDQRLRFQDRRPWAEVLKAQLNLCVGISEAESMHIDYHTPYDWWASCIKERQEIQIERILSGNDTKVRVEYKHGLQEENLTKGIKFNTETKILKSLNKKLERIDKSPIEGLSRKMPHLYWLYKISIQLASSRSTYNPIRYENSGEFRKQFWTPYLNAYRRYIRDGIKENPDVKAVIRKKGKLYYQDRKALIGIPLKRKKG